MKREKLGAILGIGATLVNLIGCSLHRNPADHDYRSHPVIVWPVSKNAVMIDYFDKDKVDRLELYDSNGRLIETFDPSEDSPSYHTTTPLQDGTFEIRAYDGGGNETRKKFRKRGDDITPKDKLFMQG